MNTKISQESLIYYVNNHYEIKGSNKPVLAIPDPDTFKSNTSGMTLGQRFRHFVAALRIDFPVFPIYLFLS